MPEFSKTDLELSMTLDGNAITTTPSKGAYTISVTCDKGATGYWDYDAWSVIVGNINEVKVKCAIAFQTGSPKFNEYIMAKSEITNSGVEKIEHEVTEQTPALTDYRYVGANPDNYVYFGCEKDSCTEDNLYRIIGVIPTQSSENGIYENRVKLVKTDYYTENESGLLKQSTAGHLGPDGYGYRWNSSGNNKWEESDLQSKVLNEVYWNSLGKYQSYIEPAKWYLGAVSSNNADMYIPNYTAEEFYIVERGKVQSSNKGNTSFIGNIGLMYSSDIKYTMSVGESKRINWINILEGDTHEWLITAESDYSDAAVCALNAHGSIFCYESITADWIRLGVRPTFYLKSSVEYTSGDGSIDNPYRIGL